MPEVLGILKAHEAELVKASKTSITLALVSKTENTKKKEKRGLHLIPSLRNQIPNGHRRTKL